MDRVRKIEILQQVHDKIDHLDFGICGVIRRLSNSIDKVTKEEVTEMLHFLDENKPKLNPAYDFYASSVYWRGDHYWWHIIDGAKPGTLEIRRQYLAELIKNLKES